MPYKTASKLAYFGLREKFFETRAVFPELRGIFSVISTDETKPNDSFGFQILQPLS
jgi:hypothetical protein